MEAAYDGRQIVGMDLHRRRSVLVRMTEDGTRLGTAKITNSAAELRREIARAGECPTVVLEAAPVETPAVHAPPAVESS